MKILIVENEVYLAQSIDSKLTELGYICKVAMTNREALVDENFNIVLLSTNISGEDFNPIIKKHKDSIIF
jgi:DNA-binding response OmpR family regulator